MNDSLFAQVESTLKRAYENPSDSELIEIGDIYDYVKDIAGFSVLARVADGLWPLRKGESHQNLYVTQGCN
jgi:hypothetical protein